MKNLIVRNAAGRVVETYPDFDPGEPVRVAGDVIDDGHWVYDGPTRHPYSARIRNTSLNITVCVLRDWLSPRYTSLPADWDEARC